MRKWSVGFVSIVGVITLALATATPAGAKTTAHTAKGRHLSASAVLEPMLLTVADLPSGWATGGSSSGTSTPPSCLARYFGGGRTDPTVQTSFAGGDFRMLDESLTQGGRSAPAEYRRVVRALDRCRHILLRDGKTAMHGSIEPISLPRVAQASDAFQLRFSIAGFTLDADLTVFRQGTILGVTLYADLGAPATATVVRLDRSAVTKVTRAGAARAARRTARAGRGAATAG